MVYNYYRDYDPSLGRYITSDPIGLEGGINPYAYVGGTPLRVYDRFGLAPGDKFPSVDDAAIDAGNYARTLKNQRIEYGGWIVKDGNCYLYTLAQGTGDRVKATATPVGGVAKWHTHPIRLPGIFFDEDEEFSRTDSEGNGDQAVVEWFRVPLYLRTPRGVNKVLMTTKPWRERVLPKRAPQSCEC